MTCRAARDAASTRRRPSACAAASGPRFWFLASTRSPTASTQRQQRRPGACGEGRTPSPPPPTPAPHSDEFRTRSCLVCCGCPRLQAAGQRVEEGSTTQLMPAGATATRATSRAALPWRASRQQHLLCRTGPRRGVLTKVGSEQRLLSKEAYTSVKRGLYQCPADAWRRRGRSKRDERSARNGGGVLKGTPARSWGM